MFGEMIGVWLMTALKNYETDPSKLKNQQTSNIVPENLQSVNLVEIGPGTGQMMSDVLRTIKQFTGNLKNVHVNMIDASPNLVKTQQERLLKYLQEDLQIFMTYQVPKRSQKKQKEEENAPIVDKFINKDQNFSITWYPSLKDFYNEYL